MNALLSPASDSAPPDRVGAPEDVRRTFEQAPIALARYAALAAITVWSEVTPEPSTSS